MSPHRWLFWETTSAVRSEEEGDRTTTYLTDITPECISTRTAAFQREMIRIHRGTLAAEIAVLVGVLVVHIERDADFRE